MNTISKNLLSVFGLSFICLNINFSQGVPNSDPCDEPINQIECTFHIVNEEPINPLDPIGDDDVFEMPNGGNNNNGGGSTSADRTKIIYFVHGLAGTSQSWHGAAKFTDIEWPTAKTYRPDYSGNVQSFWDAGSKVIDETNSISGFEDIEPEERYIISHSQGGLVSRYVDNYFDSEGPNSDERTFNGFITVGTPNAGAAILNDTDEIYALADETIQKLGLPLVLENVENITSGLAFAPVLELLGVDNALSNAAANLLPEVSSFVSFNVLPQFFQNFLTPITEQYNETNFSSNDFANYTSTFPTAAFFGIETDPQFFRYLSTFKGEASASFSTPFSMTDDSEVVKWVDDTTDEYYANYLIYKDLEDWGCPFWAWLTPTTAIQCLIIELNQSDFGDIADAYLDGYSFLNTLNKRWMTIIGATEAIVGTTSYICECEDIMSGQGGYFEVNDPSECNSNGFMYCESYPFTDVTIEILPNDGVVTKKSQIALPGVNPEFVLEMTGANHAEERNSPMTQAMLDKIYNGEVGDSFKLDN